MPSPTALTLGALRRAGYTAAVVERFIAQANVRRDLFGFADVIACHPTERSIVLVQTTTAANLANRLAKAKGRTELRDWLSAGGRFVLHGWRRAGKHWAVRTIEVRGEVLAAVVLTAPPRRRRERKQRLLFGE
jgi:hypothetical protein